MLALCEVILSARFHRRYSLTLGKFPGIPRHDGGESQDIEGRFNITERSIEEWLNATE